MFLVDFHGGFAYYRLIDETYAISCEVVYIVFVSYMQPAFRISTSCWGTGIRAVQSKFFSGLSLFLFCFFGYICLNA